MTAHGSGISGPAERQASRCRRSANAEKLAGAPGFEPGNGGIKIADCQNDNNGLGAQTCKTNPLNPKVTPMFCKTLFKGLAESARADRRYPMAAEKKQNI